MSTLVPSCLKFKIKLEKSSTVGYKFLLHGLLENPGAPSIEGISGGLGGQIRGKMGESNCE